MPLIPGQGTQAFVCYQRKPGTTETGRPTKGAYEPIGTVIGMLTNATPKEQLLWSQQNHPISHKLVLPMPDAIPEGGDFLTVGEDESTRYFYVQGYENPGDLFHFVVVYLIEREGLDCQSTSPGP